MLNDVRKSYIKTAVKLVDVEEGSTERNEKSKDDVRGSSILLHGACDL